MSASQKPVRHKPVGRLPKPEARGASTLRSSMYFYRYSALIDAGLIEVVKDPAAAAGFVVSFPSAARLGSRMADVHEGVMESWHWGGKERFQASVHTSEGRKTLEGTVWPDPREDAQSGPLVAWRCELQAAEDAIRSASDGPNAVDALRAIAAVWERLDKAAELAAARSRILVGKVDMPALAPVPRWFADQEGKLCNGDEGEIAANPLAIRSTELLIRAVIARAAQRHIPMAELDTGPLGRVVVDWQIPEKRLRWLVEALDIPWPSAKVYQVACRVTADGARAADTHIFYNAFDAVDSLVDHLGVE